MKKRVKKAAANEKIERMRTGGGSFEGTGLAWKPILAVVVVLVDFIVLNVNFMVDIAVVLMSEIAAAAVRPLLMMMERW